LTAKPQRRYKRGENWKKWVDFDAVPPKAVPPQERKQSHSPYFTALGIDKALAEIELASGIKYDPKVVEMCLKFFREKGFQIPI
jgi:hypothetical protein